VWKAETRTTALSSAATLIVRNVKIVTQTLLGRSRRISYFLIAKGAQNMKIL